MNPAIRKLHEAQLRKDLPEFRAGDTVRVNVRLKEGEGEKEKERLQAFEGVVISKKGRASSATFTVRRVSFGVGIERIFPLHSPTNSSNDEVGKGKVRRARLNYLRDLGWTLVIPSSPGFGKCFSYQAIERLIESILWPVSARPCPSRG